MSPVNLLLLNSSKMSDSLGVNKQTTSSMERHIAFQAVIDHMMLSAQN